MVKVSDVYSLIDSTFPYSLQMDGDNSGIICVDNEQPVNTILLALDITNGVIDEAVKIGANLIIAHHPLFYSGISSIVKQDAFTGKAYKMIQNNISAICAHTNLDIANGGVNDTLTQILGLSNVLGFYSKDNENFLGRIGTPSIACFDKFLKMIKSKLNCENIRYVKSTNTIKNVALIGGSAANNFSDAIKAGADTYITGDCKYDHFMQAKEMGFNLIDAGHFKTENVILPKLSELFKKNFPNIDVIVSQTHCDCIKTI